MISPKLWIGCVNHLQLARYVNVVIWTLRFLRSLLRVRPLLGGVSWTWGGQILVCGPSVRGDHGLRRTGTIKPNTISGHPIPDNETGVSAPCFVYICAIPSCYVSNNRPVCSLMWMRRSDGTIRLNASETPNTQMAAVTEQTLLDRQIPGSWGHCWECPCRRYRMWRSAVSWRGRRLLWGRRRCPGRRIQRGEEKWTIEWFGCDGIQFVEALKCFTEGVHVKSKR